MDKLQRLLGPDPRLRSARPGMPDPGGRCVIYWMQRAQRGVDNGALNLAIAAGNALNVPVLAVFGLTASYPGAQRRHSRLLLDGLFDVAHDLPRRRVTFVVSLRDPNTVLTALAEEVGAAMVVGDENPVRIARYRSTQKRPGIHPKTPRKPPSGEVDSRAPTGHLPVIIIAIPPA